MATKPDDTRTRLLEAAGEVFAEKGFQAATVREICSRAGANLAAINYYFGDKLRLYVAVVGYAHGDEANRPLPDFPPGTPPEVKLRKFVEQSLATPRDREGPAWRHKLMMRELAEPTDACMALVDAYIRPKARVLDVIVAELLPEMGESDRQLVAFSVVGQCLFHRVHCPIASLLIGEENYRALDVARLADHITRFSLAALGRHMPLDADGQPGSIGPEAASGRNIEPAWNCASLSAKMDGRP
jgi:AcrR family transcriptional regulator